MAAVTLTSTQVNNGPVLGDRPGLNVKRVLFSGRDTSGLTLCTSVCLQMVAIPDGARVVDVLVKCTGISTQVGNFTVGDGSSTARYVSAISVTASSVLSRMNVSGGAGWRYSLTQSASTPFVFAKFDTIDMTFVALTSTNTMSIEMSVWYLMERDANI
ncbi:hypothetical protein UFOVP1244_29 [uncultured Caudovirales phage]|uniref:Uncharacterized protein n=1 Tax=uncultured Caudovirales phage TaxID=2100421 RepID=A0A6J5RDA4_9CAUD|nr:hypothetical protein UFOVP1244_29 [uncultured Caudovirales phage]